MDFLKSAFGGLIPIENETAKQNNDEDRASAMPPTYDVEEYTRIVTGKTVPEPPPATVFGFIPIASPRPPSPPKTEHLGAFWQDDFQPEASLHNPLYSRASLSLSATLRASRRLSPTSATVELRSRSPSAALDLSATSRRSSARRSPSPSDAPLPSRSAPVSPTAAAKAGAALSGVKEDPDEPPRRHVLGTRDGDMNFILALPIVYVAFRRCYRQVQRRQREEGARRGRLLDVPMSSEEKEQLEATHYKQFKKMLISRRGIRVRLHDFVESRDVALRVDSSRRTLLLVRGLVPLCKVPLRSLTSVKRGRTTDVFRKKERLQGLQASRCFSVVSSEGDVGELDFEVLNGHNSYLALASKKKRFNLLRNKNISNTPNASGNGSGNGNGGGNGDKTPASMAAPEEEDEDEEEGGEEEEGAEASGVVAGNATAAAFDALGNNEAYLNDRKFYANGFERLIEELNGPASFYWDPNGSLRKVTRSAFDEKMMLRRLAGTLDLDESEAEKKKRREEEERQQARIKAMQEKAVARKVAEDAKKAKLQAKKDAAAEKARVAKERRAERRDNNKARAKGDDRRPANKQRSRTEGEDKAEENKATKAEEEMQAIRAARQAEIERRRQQLLEEEQREEEERRRRKEELLEEARARAAEAQRLREQEEERRRSLAGMFGLLTGPNGPASLWAAIMTQPAPVEEEEEVGDERGYLEDLEGSGSEGSQGDDEDYDSDEDEDDEDYDEDDEEEYEDDDDDDEGEEVEEGEEGGGSCSGQGTEEGSEVAGQVEAS